MTDLRARLNQLLTDSGTYQQGRHDERHRLRQLIDIRIDLRATRRPKPLSLKQQALATLEEEPDDGKELLVFDTAQVNIIRRALEQLDD